jgi:hypothetical protein
MSDPIALPVRQRVLPIAFARRFGVTRIGPLASLPRHEDVPPLYRPRYTSMLAARAIRRSRPIGLDDTTISAIPASS